MKTIIVPPPVKVQIGERNDDFTFKDFMEVAIDNYAPFGNGVKGAAQSVKIFNEISEEKEIKLEDSDYEAMRKALEPKPANEKPMLHPRFNRHALTFYDAFNKAGESKP